MNPLFPSQEPQSGIRRALLRIPLALPKRQLTVLPPHRSLRGGCWLTKRLALTTSSPRSAGVPSAKATRCKWRLRVHVLDATTSIVSPIRLPQVVLQLSRRVQRWGLDMHARLQWEASAGRGCGREHG